MENERDSGDNASREAAMARLIDENAMLREQLSNLEIARAEYPVLRFVEVSVIPEAFPHPDGTILNRGTEDGVIPQSIVVSQGALLGVVVRAGPRTSWMRYISSNDSYIPAKAVPGASGDTPLTPPTGESSTGELCLLSGIGQDEAQASFYAVETQAREGWFIVTASDGALRLPEGILIGTLTADPVDSGEPGIKTATIRLAASRWRTTTAVAVKELRQ